MRTLLPDRLLEPMIPIVNPRVIAQGKTMPKSPRVLYERLSKTARDGVAEVSDFRTMWTSPELKEVWEHVDARVRENNGQLLQPTGTWERDYDVLLETLAKDEQAQKDEQERAAEETDRTQSAEGNWRTVVEGFAQKNVPGVRVAPSRSRNAVTVTLAKAGMAFDVQLGSADGSWVVSNKPSVLSPEKPATKLETAICAYLNTRPRQWDLAFLLVSFLPCGFFFPNEAGCSMANKTGHDHFLFNNQTNTVCQMHQNDRRHCPTPDNPPSQGHSRTDHLHL